MAQRYRIDFFQIPRWQIVLVAALVLAFALALVILALGFFVLIFPVLVVAAAIAYLLRFLPSTQKRRPESETDIIDGEYRVLDERRSERDQDEPR